MKYLWIFFVCFHAWGQYSLTADNGVVLDRENNRYTATGNVNLTTPNLSVNAAELILYFKDTPKIENLSRIIATNNVTATYKSIQLTTDVMTYSPATQQIKVDTPVQIQDNKNRKMKTNGLVYNLKSGAFKAVGVTTVNDGIRQFSGADITARIENKALKTVKTNQSFTMKNRGMTVKGRSGDYDFNSKIVTINNLRAFDTNIKINATSGRFDTRRNIITAKNVDAKKKNIRLKSLTGRYDLNREIFSGTTVQLTQNDVTLDADNATYDVRNNKITTQNMTAIQQDIFIQSEQGTYDLNTQDMTLTGSPIVLKKSDQTLYLTGKVDYNMNDTVATSSKIMTAVYDNHTFTSQTLSVNVNEQSVESDNRIEYTSDYGTIDASSGHYHQGIAVLNQASGTLNLGNF